MKNLPKFLDEKAVYRVLLKKYGKFEVDDYEFGTTQIFFKNNTFDKYDALVKNMKENKDIDIRVSQNPKNRQNHFFAAHENS